MRPSLVRARGVLSLFCFFLSLKFNPTDRSMAPNIHRYFGEDSEDLLANLYSVIESAAQRLTRVQPQEGGAKKSGKRRNSKASNAVEVDIALAEAHLVRWKCFDCSSKHEWASWICRFTNTYTCSMRTQASEALSTAHSYFLYSWAEVFAKLQALCDTPNGL